MDGNQACCVQASEQYRPHFDYFHDKMNTVNGGQRLATFLMYLSDVQEGGETVFPRQRYKAGDFSPPCTVHTPCLCQTCFVWSSPHTFRNGVMAQA